MQQSIKDFDFQETSVIDEINLAQLPLLNHKITFSNIDVSLCEIALELGCDIKIHNF